MSVVDHSPIAPSAMHMTVACPGSLPLQSAVPEPPDTEEILEGEAAHVVAAWAARGKLMPVGYEFTHKGRPWKVDVDMHVGARIYASVCNDEPQLMRIVEERVDVPKIHADCWGTPDFAASYGVATKLSLVRGVDYKYGHRFVDPFENWQGVSYMSGTLAKLGVSVGDDELPVEFAIVQPRSYHRDGPVQRWRTTPFKLHQYVVRAREAVALALAPGAPTRSGPHCLDCKARHACPTLRTTAANVVDFSGTAELETLDVVSAAQELRILREGAARLDARATGLAIAIEADIRAGKRVPFWKLEPGQSKLKWLPGVTVDEVQFVGAMAGVNAVKPPELYTPTQCVKMGIDAKVIDQYADRQPGGVSLKPDDSTKVRKIFGDSAQ